jgi:hypothetical protein
MTASSYVSRERAVRGLVRDTAEILGQAASLHRASDGEAVAGHLSAAGKAGSALSGVEDLLVIAGEHSGVDRARFLLHAFDASWLGWNACFSRAWSSDRSDVKQYRKSVKELAPTLKRAPGFKELRSSFSSVLREPCKTQRPGVAVRVCDQILHASRGTGVSKRLLEVEPRLRQASLARATSSDVLNALYDIRCARLHGNLWPMTLGRVGAMRDLALASTGLTLVLVQAFGVWSLRQRGAMVGSKLSS